MGRLVAWLAFLVVALAGLSVLGGGASSPPLLRGSDAVARWAEQRDVAMIVIAAVRLVAIVLGWYLLGSTLVAAVAHATRIAPLARVAEAVAVPGVRRIVQAALGATFAGSAFVVASSGPARVDAPQMTMRRTSDSNDVTMVRVDAATTIPSTTTTTTTVGAPPATKARTEWAVRPGDHLWRIAEEVLGADLGRAPSDRETDPYWRRLIEVNRNRLADPNNPDLIFPGQVLVVPPT